MSFTQKYRDQHDELVQLVLQVTPLLTTAKVDEKCQEIASIMTTLTGKLKMHLAVEDQYLYPALQKAANPNVQKKANDFAKEMGAITTAYLVYRQKWGLPTQMKANPNEFIKDTQAVFKVLKTRIDKENGELYKLADEFHTQKAS